LVASERGVRPELFDNIRIKEVELRNRIVFAPVVTNFGLRSEQAMRYYAERAYTSPIWYTPEK